MAFRKNILISFGTNGVVYFFQFLTTIVASRILTPEQVGVFAVAMAIVLLFQDLREFGIVPFLIQEREVNADKIGAAFALAIIIGWGFGTLVFLARNWAAEFYGNAQLSDILTILALGFFTFPFGLPAVAMLRRERRFASLALVSIVSASGTFATTTGLLLAGYGTSSLGYGILAGNILQSVTALYYWPDHLFLRPTLRASTSIITFGIQASVASVISRLGQIAPDLLLGRLVGMHDTAIFARGRVLPLVAERMTIAPTHTAAVSELASRIRENQDIQDVLVRLVQYLSILYWSILAFLFINSGQIIELLYGPQWGRSAPVLMAVCASQALLLLTAIARMYMFAAGHITRVLYNDAAILLAVVTTIWLGSHTELTVLTWLLVIPSLVSLLIYWLHMAKHLGLDVLSVSKALRLSLLLVAGICCSCYLADLIMGYVSQERSLLWLAVILTFKAVAACAASVAILKFAGHFFYDQIENAFRSAVHGVSRRHKE